MQSDNQDNQDNQDLENAHSSNQPLQLVGEHLSTVGVDIGTFSDVGSGVSSRGVSSRSSDIISSIDSDSIASALIEDVSGIDSAERKLEREVPSADDSVTNSDTSADCDYNDAENDVDGTDGSEGISGKQKGKSSKLITRRFLRLRDSSRSALKASSSLDKSSAKNADDSRT